MKSHVRAAVAATAIAHSRGRKVSSVYAYGEESGHINTEASFSGDRLTGYDHTNRCHFDGTLPNLYHYGERAHIELKSKGDGKYDGYDYSARCHFEVKVRGKDAELYDYGERQWFAFSS